MSEKEFGGRVQRESRQGILNVDSDPFLEALPHLRDDLVCMVVKEFKVADPILAEERSGHGPVEPARAEVSNISVRSITPSSYFHRSPVQRERVRYNQRKQVRNRPSELKTPVPNKGRPTSRNASPFSYSSKCVDSTICWEGGSKMNITSGHVDFFERYLDVLRLGRHDL